MTETEEQVFLDKIFEMHFMKHISIVDTGLSVMKSTFLMDKYIKIIMNDFHYFKRRYEVRTFNVRQQYVNDKSVCVGDCKGMSAYQITEQIKHL